MGMLLALDTINISLSPQMVWIVFFIAMIIGAILSAVLVYHWKGYSYAPKQAAKALFVYITGYAILTAVSLITAIVFTLSAS
jgi:Trk-type K+ transport system membrane component